MNLQAETAELIAPMPFSMAENGELARHMLETAVEYKELRMMYACAIKEVQTKFEVLNTEFNILYKRNPISSMQTRLKSSASTIEKFHRKGLSFSLENLEEHIQDMAGIRIICSYVDDIYTLAESIIKQDDITLVEKKDYIANPKPNGYRSLHLIISVPVFFSQQKRDMKVEIQIRTIAMDFWASLEHQIKYKKVIPDQDNIVAKLRACADDIARIDGEMMEIHRQLEATENREREEDSLLAILRKLDAPIS